MHDLTDLIDNAWKTGVQNCNRTIRMLYERSQCQVWVRFHVRKSRLARLLSSTIKQKSQGAEPPIAPSRFEVQILIRPDSHIYHRNCSYSRTIPFSVDYSAFE